MAATADPQVLKEKLAADAAGSENEVEVISSSDKPVENGLHENGEAASTNGEHKRKSTGAAEEDEADSTPVKKPRLSDSQAAEADKPEADQQPVTEGDDSHDAEESRDTDYNEDSKDVPSEEDGTAPPDPEDAEGEDSAAAAPTE